MALTGSRPARIKAGIVMSPPPPAMASTHPAATATPNRVTIRPRSIPPIMRASPNDLRAWSGVLGACRAGPRGGRRIDIQPVADHDGHGPRGAEDRRLDE